MQSLLLWALSCGLASKAGLTSLSWGILDTWLNQHSWDLLIQEKWLDIHGSASFTAVHFVAKYHTMDKIPFLLLALEIIFFQSLPKIHDHK